MVQFGDSDLQALAGVLRAAESAPDREHFDAAVGPALRRFDERDRWVLDLLRPHLALAYRRAEARGRARDIAARRVTPGERHGVIALDERGRPVAFFGHARRWLKGYFETPRTATLPAELERWAAQLRAGGDDDLPLPAEPLVRANADGRLTIHHLGDRLLLVHDYRPRLSGSSCTARGLTAREGEVLDCARRGMSDAAIGEALFISPRTVRKHLERSYRKLGVHNRVAAIVAAFTA